MIRSMMLKNVRRRLKVHSISTTKGDRMVEGFRGYHFLNGLGAGLLGSMLVGRFKTSPFSRTWVSFPFEKDKKTGCKC